MNIRFNLQRPINSLIEKMFSTSVPTRLFATFNEFLEHHLRQGVYLSYLMGFFLFVALMIGEALIGGRFGAQEWLLIALWLVPQALFVEFGVRRRPGKISERHLRAGILITNALMHIVLSVTHTKLGDQAPYFHIVVVGQIVFGYAFTSLTFRSAVICGLSITTMYLGAAFLFTPLLSADWLNAVFLFGLVNIIGAASCWRVEENYRHQYQLVEQLHQAAESDPLTGLFNRRGLGRCLEELLACSRRENYVVGIAVLDLDKFKWVNDNCGHPAGDALLKEVAIAINSLARRPLDFAARLGGDEFLVAWSAEHENGLLNLGQSLLAKVANAAQLQHQEVTASVGFLAVNPRTSSLSANEMLKLADDAATVAKQNGGNHLVTHFESIKPLSAVPATAKKGPERWGLDLGGLAGGVSI